MKNTQIIYNELVQRGMDPAQLEKLMAKTGDLPFHTLPEWARMGYQVKAGEKELFTCYLWKHTNKPGKAAIQAAQDAGEDAPELSPHFYQKLSYIYAFSQVEKSKPAPDLETVKAQLSQLPGLTVTVKGEKSGSPVVWLSGEVEQNADAIKGAGGVWSNKRQAYYIKPGTASDASPSPDALAPAPAVLALPAHIETPDPEPAPAPVPDPAPSKAKKSKPEMVTLTVHPGKPTPQPWKKCHFFTIRNGSGKPAAEPVDGFTDGIFNYYRAEVKGGEWYAIHPVFGLAVTHAKTRKAAQEAALNVIDKVREMENTPNDRRDQYAALIKAAQDGDNTSLF